MPLWIFQSMVSPYMHAVSTSNFRKVFQTTKPHTFILFLQEWQIDQKCLETLVYVTSAQGKKSVCLHHVQFFFYCLLTYMAI